MAIGDLVATLLVPGASGASFQLVDNPGGLFTLSGNLLLQAVDVPSGNYPITIQAQFHGQVLTQSFVVDHLPFPPPPPPPPPLTSSIAVVPDTLGVGQTATVYFTWNDTVEDFTPAAVAVTRGSIGALTQVSPTLFTAVFTPDSNVFAIATLQVQQSGVGGAIYFNAAHSSTAASNVADVSINTITPIGDFFFGINLSGAENEFPVFPTLAQLQYWTARGVQHFRIPFGWSKVNSQNGSVVGIQHAAFGPLDTTSTGFPLTGTNLLYNSVIQPGEDFSIGAAPWKTFVNNSGAISVSPLSAQGPLGDNDAALVTFSRSSPSDISVLFQNYTGGGPGIETNSVWLKASTPSDVGKVVQLTLFADVTFAYLQVTLTATWTRYSTTGTMPVATRYAWQLGTIDFNASTGSVGVLVWGAQTNLGTLAPYQPTVMGYVQAMDQLMVDAGTAGALLLLDCHDFGAGPGGLNVGDPGLPPSALADMWDKIAQRYSSNPVIWGMEYMNEPVNGFDSSVVFSYSQLCNTAVRARGFGGTLGVDGVNFTGAWNWVSGQGQPFNNANLYLLTDPLNNLLFHFHTYFDRNSSGAFFSWNIETGVVGQAPPPIPTSHTIGLTRLNDEMLPWLAQHGLKSCYSEFGVSVDPVFKGGSNNWADWIVTARNTIDLCRANNIPVFLWGGGLGFGSSYPFNPEPYSAVTGAKVFDGTGVDSVLVAGLINHYVTNPQPQPTAYLLVPPQTITASGDPNNPIVTNDVYGTVGTPTNPATIIYGGIVPAGAIIVPHAKFSDGSPAGGTFNPSSIPLTPGDNALATFTYTPANVGTIFISTTNNQGWADPPAVVCSTANDAYRNLPVAPTNIYGLYRRYTPFIGDVLTLKRDDGAVQSFGFDLGNDFDRVAIQTWAGKQSGIAVLNWSNMGPSDGILDFTNTVNNSGGLSPVATQPTLTLQNSAGYPEILVTSGAGYFNMQVSNDAGVNGNQFSAYARMNQSASAGQGLWRTDWFTGPLGFGNGLTVVSTGFIGGVLAGPPQFVPNVTLSFGVITGSYHSYASSYQSGVTNGFIGYRDASVIAQTTTTYTINAAFNSTAVNFGNFRFGSGNWIGVLTNFETFAGYALSPTNVSAITTADSNYYSTPLSDTLPPILVGVVNQHAVSGSPGVPFSGITLQDVAGTTDSIVFTLTGHAATLSGTGLTGSNPYTLTTDTIANINTKLPALQFSTTGSPGDVTHIAMVTISSTGLTGSVNQDVTTIAAANPVISGMVAPSVSMDQGAPALWQVLVTDSNPTPTVSASIAVTGGSGVFSHFGPYAPSGTGPFTFGAMSPTELTRALRNLIWAPATHTVGTVTTFALTVTNNLGLTASASNTITNIAPQAMPSSFTPVATPAALPANYNGLNLSGGENTPIPNYAVLNSAGFAWALSKNFTTIRAPFKMYFMVQTANTPPTGYQFYEQFYANFHAADIAALHSAVEIARANGQYIILDDHSQAGIGNPFPTLTQDDPAPPSLPFLFWGADPRVPVSAFGDMWQRMTTYFALYSNVLMGLQNEPALGGTPWFNMEVAGANGVRAASSTIPYLISGNNSNVTQFDYTPFTGYVDPAGGPFFFDVHMYFDPGHQGTGNTCLSNTIGSYFSTFTTWLNANGYKAFVSEFAWGTDITCEPTFGASVVAYFNTNSNVYPGWQWWGGGDFSTSYPYYMGPIGSPPQYALLAPYLP